MFFGVALVAAILLSHEFVFSDGDVSLTLSYDIDAYSERNSITNKVQFFSGNTKNKRCVLKTTWQKCKLHYGKVHNT